MKPTLLNVQVKLGGTRWDKTGCSVEARVKLVLLQCEQGLKKDNALIMASAFALSDTISSYANQIP